MSAAKAPKTRRAAPLPTTLFLAAALVLLACWKPLELALELALRLALESVEAVVFAVATLAVVESAATLLFQLASLLRTLGQPEQTVTTDACVG